MRNLKRVLSLALALVMVLGMMVITTSAAAFTDAEEITNTEAVDVMSAIGVINGFEAADGTFSFKPTETLTREQGAALICYMLMGKDAADKLVGSGNFTDVKTTRWSAGEIDYCANLGILDGMGDGTFDPTGELKAVQFGKMLLCALGYDADVEGYVGKNWATTIAADMIDAGLDVDGVAMDAQLTREQAAQMCLQAMTAPMVEYENKGGSISVNGAEIAFGASKATYVTTTLAKEQRISAQMLTNSNAYTVEFGEKYFPNLYLTTNVADDFGRPAHVWTYKTEDIGQYVDADLLVKEYTTAVQGKTVYSDIGYSKISDYVVEVYVDGLGIVAGDALIIPALNKTNGSPVAFTGNGVLTQVFVNHEEEIITFVFVNTYLAEVTSDYNATLKRAPITVYTGYAANGTAKEESQILNGPAYAELAEGDMLLVTRAYNYNTGKYTIKSVELAEVISSAKITSYTTKKGTDTQVGADLLNTLVANDTNYKTSAKACYDVADVLNYNESLTDLKNATYDLYMDNYGYVLGLQQVKTFDQYVFVVGYEPGSSVLAQAIDKALIITTDGEMKTVNAVDDYMDKGVAKQRFDKPEEAVNSWFSYDVKDDGTYVLKAPAANQGAVVSTTRVKDPNKADISGLYADLGTGKTGAAVAYGNANSVYIAVDADTSVNDNGSIVKVNGMTTGIKNTNLIAADVSSMKNFTGKADTFYMYNNLGYVTYAVVVGEDVSTSDNMVFFTSGATGRYYDSALKGFYVTYEAIQDGELTTVKVLDAEASSTNPGTDELYKATFTADGYIKALTAKNSHGATNTGENATNGYTLNADAKGLDLKLIGSTLYVIEAKQNNNYVVIGDECKVFFDSAADKDGYIEYPTAKAALGALADDAKYVVAQVTTVCDTITGYATTLIITEAEVGTTTTTAYSTVDGLQVKSTVATGALKITTATGDATLATAASSAKDGTLTVTTSKTGGDITVAQLKNALEVNTGKTAGDNDTMTVTLTDWTGSAVAVTDESVVVSGMQIVYKANTAANTNMYYVYTVTVK